MSIKTVYLKKIIIGLFLTGAIFMISLSTEAASQSDAIAVRIMPNVNHDSIETWYANQGFKGSPQSLIVDGYEAIRDGRTVFVNAANVDLNSKKIYTNIYLISYNQESETKTLDILGQLVSHWKFNDNVSTQGYCSVSSINCQADSECPTDYICSNTNSSGSPDYQTFTKGKCILKKDKVCHIDSDCPANLFCNSLKAKTIRDISRLSKINKIAEALESFKSINGRYPALDSGTYVLGSSVSVWPSWKETFWSQLSAQPITDPINSLGYCEGYDANTCWNNKNNTFVNSNLSLPSGSYAFVYKALRGGIDYSLCSAFETSSFGYNTAEGRLISKTCNFTNSSENSVPILVASSINGVAGKEFNGYLMVKDEDGDAISWKLTPVSDFSSWSSAPVLVNTNTPGQKKLYAARTGNIGNYEMNLTLTDSQGGINVIKIVVKIDVVGKVSITAQDAVYSIDATNPTYTFFVTGNNLEKKYSIDALDGRYSSVFNNDLALTSFSSDLNGLQITAPVNMPSSDLIKETATIPFRISFSNFGSKITKDINITFKIEKPTLNFTCDSNARIGQPYQINDSSCLLGGIKSGNYNLSYQLTSAIPGLSIKTQNDNAYLTSSAISLLAPTSSDVTIKVSNQYNLTAEKSFKLTVNSFCGDGIKQNPNSEGQGGINNDGNEECDGLDGVATSVGDSSATKQYGCTTGLNVKSPFPILNNSSCVFAGRLTGGGYCGDEDCQADKENCSTCKVDCGKCAAVCGDSELDPGESCEAGDSRECDQIVKWINPPGYCGVVTKGNTSVKGTQTCNSTCSGWGDCIGGSPDLIGNSSTNCGTTNPQEYNYSCCEIVACVPDQCDCCGRDSNSDYGWIKLEDEAVSTYKYENIITKISPSNKMCSIGTTPCVCGASTDYFGNPVDCPDTPACPGIGDDPTRNSCVLARDADNLKNWIILTNHTTVYYRCWK